MDCTDVQYALRDFYRPRRLRVTDNLLAVWTVMTWPGETRDPGRVEFLASLSDISRLSIRLAGLGLAYFRAYAIPTTLEVTQSKYPRSIALARNHLKRMSRKVGGALAIDTYNTYIEALV